MNIVRIANTVQVTINNPQSVFVRVSQFVRYSQPCSVTKSLSHLIAPNVFVFVTGPQLKVHQRKM